MSELTIDDGVTPYGTRTKLHIATDTVIQQKTYDAEPILQAAKEAREQTEGQRWGDGKVVGKVPMAVYTQCLHMSSADQHKYLSRWLRENPGFVTFEKFLK